MTSHAVYRFLVRLYPPDFRARYAEDLIQHFADLVRDRGRRSAWARTSLDLIVTLPRYRLESVMSPPRTAAVLFAAIVLLAALGTLSGLTDLIPGSPYIGGALVVAALVLVLAQRSALARAIRTPDSGRRRRRLAIGAVLAGVFVISIASFASAISDDAIGDVSLFVHNAIGIPALLGALAFLVAGLLTPRSLASHQTNPS